MCSPHLLLCQGCGDLLPSATSHPGVPGIVAQSSTPSISLHRVTRTSSRQSLTSSASQQSITSTGGLSTSSFGSQKTSNSSSSSSTASSSAGPLSPHSMLAVMPTPTTVTTPVTPVMQSYVNTVSSKSAAPSTIAASATEAPSGGGNSFPGVTQYFSVTTLDEEKPQIMTPVPITSDGVSGPSTSDTLTRAGVKGCSVQVVKNGNTILQQLHSLCFLYKTRGRGIGIVTKCVLLFPPVVAANISPPKIAGKKRSYDEGTLSCMLVAHSSYYNLAV